ncbi:hypothetical protein JRQ81_005521 [Phrynocephalus forsythii]|uniref:t-SNARE coiled-coil homology domain-containing protein n=1 Tax=Phrynocephalus forsythii TaxID=171643 RepID=A0A9Q0Y3R4_9SAUR|nr:hypothetical protein JRQ81_005521 [Phrynocephalus forsythii]
MTRRIDEVSRKVDDTKQDLSHQIKQTQAAVDSNGQKLENMAGEIKNSQKQQLLTAKKKLTYMEDYSRRQNVKLINFVVQKRGELKQEVMT